MQFCELNDLLDRMEEGSTPQEIGKVFEDAIRPHGFIAVSAGLTQMTPQGLKWSFYFNTWPPDWLQTYQSRDFVKIDPIPTLARLLDHPFTWRDWSASAPWHEALAGFHEWVAEIGVQDGFAVPVHYSGGDLGLCVALAGRPIEAKAERRALHMLSINALRRCREIEGELIDATFVKSPLSQRETACMRWVLEGKSDRDIGQILGISHTTVHFHVERVKKKLGVRTRVQAARHVLSQGYIEGERRARR